MSWSTSELRVRLAPLNRFKPSRKIRYWPFQGGTSFVDLLCFFLSCVCYVFVRVCLYVLCGHLLGKGWPLGSRLWCLTVRLSLSHWYPWSGVVLDCTDSWSLHTYLLGTSIVYEYFVRPQSAGQTLGKETVIEAFRYLKKWVLMKTKSLSQCTIKYKV